MKTAALLATALFVGSGLAPEAQAPPVRDVGLRAMFVMRFPEEQRAKARDIALRMITYYEANHAQSPMSLELFQEASESSEAIYWIHDVPDIDSFERVEQTLQAEEGWATLVAERDAAFQLEPVFTLPASELGPRFARPLRWTKRLRATYGNYAAALEHARAVAAYANSRTDATHFEVYRGVIDDVGAIYTFSDWEGPDAWRELERELWQDEEFLRLMEGAAGLYEDGSWGEGPISRMF
jgi:hypothetical protein